MEKILSGSLYEMVEALIDTDLPLVSNLSNVSSLLYKEIKGTSWCGFYLSFDNKDIIVQDNLSVKMKTCHSAKFDLTKIHIILNIFAHEKIL